jgi:hypothetical protein
MRKIYYSILFSIVFSMVFSSIAFGQKFPKDSLMYNGNTNKFINLVIMPDGYTSAELPKFKADATAFMNYFFTQSPFSNYKNYFNVYTVNIPSNQSGVIHPHTASDCENDVEVTNPDIYFKSTMDYAGIHRLIVADYSIINTTLNDNFPQWDLVLILVNSTKYGGSGGTYSVASTDASAAQVAVHEIGHSFGNLRDEYYPGASYMIEKANTSKESNSTLVRWKNWMGINNTGIYQFSEDATWYRPHQTCKMRYNGVPFCSYCNELIIEKIHIITNAINSYTPTQNTITVTTKKIPFTLTTLKPIPNTLKITWILDGSNCAKNTETLSLDSATLTNGVHTLVATVIDTTSAVKSTTHASTHLYSVQWTINNVSTGISINTLQYKTIVNVYPNPFSSNITISYTLEKICDVRVDLLTINGTLIQTLVKQKNMPAGEYKNIANLSAQHLSPGMYLVRYTIDNYIYSERVIKE